MHEQLRQLQTQIDTDIVGDQTAETLESLEIKYLGRKNGLLTEIMKGLKEVPREQVAELGQLANTVKQHIEAGLKERQGQLNASQSTIDITAAIGKPSVGHLHPMTTAIEEVTTIFNRLGYHRTRYPEVDWDYYAFETLNMPGDHPARDEWETFFIDREPISRMGQRLLTPHTSSGQVREMEQVNKNNSLPIKMINISKCYRRQIDASHTPMFHQFEGLHIAEGINIGHLKGTLDYFFEQFFGQGRRSRLRPYHFQFTEPSFEIDISCGFCDGRGCKLCKQGWVELGGAGMVHPNVLKAGKIDPNKYSGFAFGWGVERTYLMKSAINIDDLRMLYKNDVRFLEQF